MHRTKHLWLIASECYHCPSDHLHHLILSCAKQQHTSGSPPVSMTSTRCLNSYGYASNIRHTAQCLAKSSIFSLSSLLFIFLHDSKWGSPPHTSYFRAVNIFHTWLRVFFCTGMHSIFIHVHIFFGIFSVPCMCNRTDLWNFKARKIRCRVSDHGFH